MSSELTFRVSIIVETLVYLKNPDYIVVIIAANTYIVLRMSVHFLKKVTYADWLFIIIL